MKIPLLALCALATALLHSCSSSAKPSGFIENSDQMTGNGEVPFHRSWKSPKADFSKYSHVIIAPVATDRTKAREIALEKWTSVETDLLKQEVAENATSLKNAYINAFQKSSDKQWQVNQSPPKGKPALLIELNLAEIAPSQPVIQAAGMYLTGGVLMNRPSIAIEGQIRDSRTKEVLATFADRRRGDLAVLNLSKLSSYKMHRNMMKRWANETVDWVELSEGQSVAKTIPLKLITW
ncbi:MAG: DUF3313 family protein [Verrucomicrobiaceae bacterium]